MNNLRISQMKAHCVTATSTCLVLLLSNISFVIFVCYDSLATSIVSQYVTLLTAKYLSVQKMTTCNNTMQD